jgi:septal ring-binding cell division protein DamX
MPLNLNDPDDSSGTERQGRGPILHEPVTESERSSTKWILIAVACVVVLAGGWYAWKSGVFGSRDNQEPPPPPTAQYEAEIKPVNPSQPPAKTTLSAAPAEKEAVKTSRPMGTGRYTIYISRQRERARAEEEGSRWTAAGYESFISEGDGWYKLSIGRYSTWEDAKATAITLQLGFEAGYMVGTLAE